MIKVRASILMLVVALAGAPQAVVADDAQALREAGDRTAIEALMWRYVRALDTLDADAYAGTYTENGQFSAGTLEANGRAALRDMIEGLRNGRAEREAAGEPPTPPMYHLTTDSYIEFTGADRALHHYYWLTVFAAAGEATPLRVAAVGRGIDELVRVDGHWLIQSRNVTPQE